MGPREGLPGRGLRARRVRGGEGNRCDPVAHCCRAPHRFRIARANFTHRVRWNVRHRRSRPAGYVGQLFTNPLPIALILVAVQPSGGLRLRSTCVFRAAVAASVARVLCAPAGWALLPFQDILSFLFWLSASSARPSTGAAARIVSSLTVGSS